jgi:HK97 gp10 family phage protein
MAKFKFQFELEGAEELAAKFNDIGKRQMKKILRSAVGFAATPLNAVAKQLVPEDSRQLRKSIGKVTRTYPSTGNSVCIVGPRNDFRARVVTKSGRIVLRNPTKYAHLVEGGHVIAVGGTINRGFLTKRSKIKGHTGMGRHAGFVPGVHFMESAFKQTLPAMESRLTDKVAEGLSREAAKN